MVRGLAALWVFVYHAWVSVVPQALRLPVGTTTLDLTPLASAGWVGVDVFYVLSGFLLWSAFDDWAMRRGADLQLARFAKRRALRILPPYYAQIALLAVLGLLTTAVERPTPTTLALNLTLTHGLSLAHFQAVNGVWWTLSTELQFYVVLPLLALGVRRFGWGAVLAGGLATMLAWRITAAVEYRDASLIARIWLIEQLPGRIDQFLLGMFASHLALARESRAGRFRAEVAAHPLLRGSLVLIGPLAVLALIYLLHINDFFVRYWDGHAWLYFWHLAVALGVAVSLYGIAVRPGAHAWIPRGWLARAAVAFGVTSYSFYLWHELVLRWLAAWVKAQFGEATLPAFAVNLTLGFALALAAALASFRAFERPFLRRRATLRTITASSRPTHA